MVSPTQESDSKCVEQIHQQRNVNIRRIQEILQTDAIPDILPVNMRKLKAAYRHPFEYINPRLYQKRDIVASGDPSDDTAQARFFVDNEEEFQALQGQTNNTSSKDDLLL